MRTQSLDMSLGAYTQNRLSALDPHAKFLFLDLHHQIPALHITWHFGSNIEVAYGLCPLIWERRLLFGFLRTRGSIRSCFFCSSLAVFFRIYQGLS